MNFLKYVYYNQINTNDSNKIKDIMTQNYILSLINFKLLRKTIIFVELNKNTFRRLKT